MVDEKVINRFSKNHGFDLHANPCHYSCRASVSNNLAVSFIGTLGLSFSILSPTEVAVMCLADAFCSIYQHNNSIRLSEFGY
jgi:hypothetical protein